MQNLKVSVFYLQKVKVSGALFGPSTVKPTGQTKISGLQDRGNSFIQRLFIGSFYKLAYVIREKALTTDLFIFQQ